MGTASEYTLRLILTELESHALPDDAATETTLAAILVALADPATQTTLAALLTELQAKADLTETQPVSAASLPLPSGAATETTLASILTALADPATQTTLAALLTELQAKADLTETQPVSVASLPLPSGAATETTLASLLTELEAKLETADLSFDEDGRLEVADSYSAPRDASFVTTAAEDDLTAEKVLGVAVIMAGTAASIPAAGTAGRLYYETDTELLKRDNGASWDTLTHSIRTYLADDKPFNSKGNEFDTVQAAIDDLAGDGWVFMPAGTWNERLTIAEDNVTLFSAGAGCGILHQAANGGHAITVTGAKCRIRDLQVKTTSGDGTNHCGIYGYGATDLIVTRVVVGESDNIGIQVGDGGVIESCSVNNTDSFGIYLSGSNCRVFGTIIDTTGDDGIYIALTSENCVVVGNRITGWTNEAIDDDSGTSTVASNDTT